MRPGSRLAEGFSADRLSSLLGEPRDRCDQAAAVVFGNSRQRAVFQAVISYAVELCGPCGVDGRRPVYGDCAQRRRDKAPSAGDGSRCARPREGRGEWLTWA